MRLMVTGATGFVGLALLEQAVLEDEDVVAAVRAHSNMIPSSISQSIVGDLSSNQDWSDALTGVDVVIHLAARVHVMHETANNPLAEFREINVKATLNLAKQAVASGVKRFIFISTVKVNGESTEQTGSEVSRPFCELDSPNPQDPYALSKWEAEQGLLELAKETAIEVVVIRPPLIYGPGVKGNFASMIKYLSYGLPLPFGAVHNQRSLVALDNLVDLILLASRHPAAVNQVFLVSDREDVSTTELLRKLATAMNKHARLLPVPVSWMKLAASLLGKKPVADRLFGSLQVDASKADKLLGWKPKVSMEQQLREMMRKNQR